PASSMSRANSRLLTFAPELFQASRDARMLEPSSSFSGFIEAALMISAARADSEPYSLRSVSSCAMEREPFHTDNGDFWSSERRALSSVRSSLDIVFLLSERGNSASVTTYL